MSIKIENARYVLDDIYPILEVEINGIAVRLLSEWKPTLRERGVVVLGEHVPGLEPVEITYKSGRLTVTEEVVGATDDPRFVALFEKFWRDANLLDGAFRPGPVEIPAED